MNKDDLGKKIIEAFDNNNAHTGSCIPANIAAVVDRTIGRIAGTVNEYPVHAGLKGKNTIEALRESLANYGFNGATTDTLARKAVQPHKSGFSR